MKANLCKCNNCNLIMIDQNSQINAVQYEINTNLDDKLMCDNFPFEEIAEMQLLNETGEQFWGCPICETDNFLVDL